MFGFVQRVGIHKPIDKLEKRVNDGFGFAHTVVYCCRKMGARAQAELS